MSCTRQVILFRSRLSRAYFNHVVIEDIARCLGLRLQEAINKTHLRRLSTLEGSSERLIVNNTVT